MNSRLKDAQRSLHFRRRPVLTGGLACLAMLLSALVVRPAVALGGYERDAAAARSTVPAYVPLWATPTSDGGTGAADLGAAHPDAPIAARVYLAGRNPRGLAAYASTVSDPGSRHYRRFLTVDQVQRRFGPTRGQRTAIQAWLRASGLRVTDVTAHYVAVAGTATQATRAFGVQWHSYRVAAGIPQLGAVVADTPQQAPARAGRMAVPAPLRAAVSTIVPLETQIPGYADMSDQSTTPAAVPETTTTAVPASAPCSGYFGQRTATSRPAAYGRTPPYAVCGYTPWQLRGAYGVPGTLTGMGQSMAIVAGGRTPTAARDLATFARRNGEPLRPGQLTQILPKGLDASCHTEGPEFSEDFADLEETHAMAPGAHLTDLAAKCDDDGQAIPILDAYTDVVDHHLASIVSSAYNARYNEATVSPGLIAVYEQVFAQGAAEGIGFYVDSDDEGDNSSVSPGHRPSVSFPDDDPWVTAVGGTSLAIGPGGRYRGETSWGDHTANLAANGKRWTSLPGPFLGGGGGGASRLFPQPSYQRRVVPAALSHAHGSAAPMRVLPDIAADAGSGTGVLVGVTVSLGSGQPAAYHQLAIAGTSASVMLIAGMQADVQQGDAGVPIGFANPAIYARYGTGGYHDVTGHSFDAGLPPDSTGPAGQSAPGSPDQPYLTTFGRDGTLTAGPGYDDTTGVGTPSARYFWSFPR
jgi:subtilase family serine protease